MEGYEITMTGADFFILYLTMGQKPVIDIGSSAIRAEDQLRFSLDQFSLTLLLINFFLFNIKPYLSWFWYSAPCSPHPCTSGFGF